MNDNTHWKRMVVIQLSVVLLLTSIFTFSLRKPDTHSFVSYASIQGPQGEIGPIGPQGIQGIPGPASIVPGPKGDKGDSGLPGKDAVVDYDIVSSIIQQKIEEAFNAQKSAISLIKEYRVNDVNNAKEWRFIGDSEWIECQLEDYCP